MYVPGKSEVEGHSTIKLKLLCHWGTSQCAGAFNSTSRANGSRPPIFTKRLWFFVCSFLLPLIFSWTLQVSMVVIRQAIWPGWGTIWACLLHARPDGHIQQATLDQDKRLKTWTKKVPSPERYFFDCAHLNCSFGCQAKLGCMPRQRQGIQMVGSGAS